MPRSLRRTFSALLVLALLTLGMVIVPAEARGPAMPLQRQVRLDRAVSGEAAVTALGPAIADVASAHGKSVAQLARALRDDHALAVDERGKLFYRDIAAPNVSGADAAGETAAAGAPYPLEETFALHSLPGSKRTIYLDFTGHVLSGTVWNSDNGGADILAPAWDVEGGPSVFTDTERARIQGIWQRVAEDYAPFDVDVTTELLGEDRLTRSSSSDDVYGMRVLISPISSYFGPYGGLAYVGVFDATGDFYKPALVFPEMLGNNEKTIAEAASHEVGHTFGLMHDGTTAGVEYYGGHGTGITGWAPIMGNSYSKNVTQWSKGEYPGANNTEDDLAVIRSNGVPYRADDHGDSTATATQLSAGTQLSASGIVGSTGDVDMLSFSAGAGEVSFSVVPAPTGADLDLLLKVTDASGTVLASGNPVDYLNASVSTVVPGGVYYLSVTGTGKGDLATGYSNYGSLGAWSVTGTVVDPVPVPIAPIAVAQATPTTGEAPLAVAFDATGSSDPDGSIASYSWVFGDGTSASGATVSHTYSAAGSYTAVVTVTDATGLSDSSSVAVTVIAPNSAPAAGFVATPATGRAPLPVAFDGSSSFDADGAVVSWVWDFGDGSTGFGPTATHTYLSPGAYTARLTVTDDDGATGSASARVTANAVPALIAMRVAAIQITVVATKTGRQATARVRVTDLLGRPVGGASVSGAWSGAVVGTSVGTTDGTGTAVLPSKVFSSGTVVFTVRSVLRPGYSYGPGRNLVTSASLPEGSRLTRYLR